MTDSPFPPFNPNVASPPTQPVADSKPEKAPRKKKAAAEPKAPSEIATDNLPAARQRRKRGPNKSSLKFDLPTILSAASTLNQDDYPLFEKLIGMLDEAGKPARDRLLAAIGKVFA